MNIKFNAFQSALKALLKAHKEHRSDEMVANLFVDLETIEDRAKVLRDFGTVRANIGQRSGKTVWTRAHSQKDWLIISSSSESCGHNHFYVSTKEQLSKALQEIIRGSYKTIVVDEPWYLERGDALDKNFNKILRAMAASNAPLKDMTLIVLG